MNPVHQNCHDTMPPIPASCRANSGGLSNRFFAQLNIQQQFIRLFATCAACVILSLASGVASAQLPDFITEVEGIKEYRLANGARLLLCEDASKPQFTLNVTVLVGSRHEGYGESGMAHLLEHMLFRGTEKYPDIPKLLKDRGVLNMNGTTSFDRTNYFETLPASDENLEFAIAMEADRLVRSWIKPEHFASEMTVVRNEFERGENNPYQILYQRIFANAFEWHNYGKTTIGNRSDIERVQVPSLREFYRKYYQPDNIMIVVAGKFDEDKTLALIEKHFGAIPKPKRELPQTYTSEPPQDGERTVVVRRVGDTKLAAVGYHIPSASDKMFPAVQVLGEILNMRPSGPLYKSLVETKLASSVNARPVAAHDPGLLFCVAEAPNDQDLSKVRDALLSTIEEIGSRGVSPDNVKRAVQQILRRRERQFANTERFATALSEWQAYGDWRLYFLHRDRLEKVTPADVRQAARRYCVQSNRTVGLFMPTERPVRAEIGDTPNVAKLVENYKGRKAVKQGEVFLPTPENIEKRTVRGRLESGLKFALLPKKTRDERIFIYLNMHYGDADSLKGYEVAAELFPQLLTRGTKNYSYEQFKDRLTSLSTTFSASGETGRLGIRIQTKRKSLQETMKLLKEALRNPRLDPVEFDVIKRLAVTQTKATLSDPQALAINAFRRKLSKYPKGDVRYAPSIQEIVERTEAATIDKVRKIHSMFLNGQHVEFAMVGDFDAEKIPPMLEAVFGNWKSRYDYVRIETEPCINAKPERIVINTPDKQNATYVAGRAVAMRDDAPDYEAILIGNYILGGGPLSSRLADRVRKKEGLSYGVGSQFQAATLDEDATFLIFAISNPKATEKVVATIDEEVKRLADSGVSAEELNAAKSSYLQMRQGNRSKESRLVRILARTLESGRTMQFYEESDKKIEALDRDSVDNAIRQHIDHKKMVIITAGDFSKNENPEENQPEENAPEIQSPNNATH